MPKVEASELAIRKAIKATPWALEDMHGDSPLDVSECSSAEILQLVFDKDDLVCSGSVSSFNTLPVRDWLEREMKEQIVPNPSRVKSVLIWLEKNLLIVVMLLVGENTW